MSSKDTEQDIAAQDIAAEVQEAKATQTPAAPQSEADPSMERVRQILFGSQMRDYDRRLRELGERIGSETQHLRQEQHTRGDRVEAFIRVELERLNAELRREREERLAAQQQQTDRIEALSRETATRIDELRATIAENAELHREREERLAAQQQHADRLEALSREITAQVDTLRSAIGDETRAREAALLSQSGEILDALEGRARALTETLQRERDRLQDEKTNRDELAQLFSELALRLNRELTLPEA